MAWVRLLDIPGQRIDSPSGNFYYWKIESGQVWHQKRKLRKADSASFEIWQGTEDDVFIARDKSHVYHAWSLQKSIDRDSFESMSNGYWRDKNHAYCEHETSIKALKGGDSQSFRFVGGPYAADSQYAYYGGRVLKSCARPAALELMSDSNCWYAGDGERVYFDGAELKGVQFSDWKYLSDAYSQDGRSVYFGSKKLGRVHLETWERLEDNYSRDSKSVYYLFSKIKGANPKTWSYLKHHYSRDGDQFFYGKTAMEGVDPESFEVLGERRARDKNQDYEYGRAIAID